MKNIEDILALCIEDIKAGRSTLEACLNSYSSMRRELEPLLKIALSIQEPPSFKPSNDFRIRTRVQLMDYIHDKRNEKKSWRDLLNYGTRQSWSSGWLKTVTIIVAVILALSALGTGTAYASKDSLPGDTLYSVKIGTEQVRRLLTTNDISRIELELTLADIRLGEIEALAHISPEGIALAFKGYEKNLTTAIDKAESNKDRDISAQELEGISLATLKHISILDSINDSITAPERETVKQAGEVIFRAQFKALRLLAEEDPVRATEINVETMQNQLNRANARADDGEVTEAEESLRQFKELHRFGDEISQIAIEFGYNITAINAINAQATSVQLEVIRNMYGKVSEETLASVNGVMGISIENYGEEDNRLLEINVDNNIPQKFDNNPEDPGNNPEEPGDSPEEPGNVPEEPGNGHQ